MTNEISSVNLDENNVSVLGNGINSIFFGIGWTNKDRGISDALLVNKSAGSEFKNWDKSTFTEAEKLSIFSADLHVDWEICRELWIERIFRGSFVFSKSFRCSREFSQDNFCVSLTRFSLVISENIRKMGICVDVCLSKAAAVTFKRLLAVFIDLVKLNISVNLLLIGWRNSEQCTPISLGWYLVSNNLAIWVS